MFPSPTVCIEIVFVVTFALFVLFGDIVEYGDLFLFTFSGDT